MFHFLLWETDFFLLNFSKLKPVVLQWSSVDTVCSFLRKELIIYTTVTELTIFFAMWLFSFWSSDPIAVVTKLISSRFWRWKSVFIIYLMAITDKSHFYERYVIYKCSYDSVMLRTFTLAFTQSYSFGGRIKLIISQISHELSVTIHEIRTSWKKR